MHSKHKIIRNKPEKRLKQLSRHFVPPPPPPAPLIWRTRMSQDRGNLPGAKRLCPLPADSYYSQSASSLRRVIFKLKFIYMEHLYPKTYLKFSLAL